MLRPRASDMIELAVPGSLAARSADRDRHAQRTAAPKRTTRRGQPACAASAVRGLRLRGARRRRRGIRESLPLQQRCRGGRAEPMDHARHGAGVLPPVQPARRSAGAEPLQAAAERHDGAGQLRPVRMPRPDAVAAAHPGDRATERAADSTRPRPAPSPLAGQAGPATMGTSGGSGAGACLARAAAGRRSTGRGNGRATPAARGRVRAGPICIGGIGFGRRGEWVSHCGRTLHQDGGGKSSFFS